MLNKYNTKNGRSDKECPFHGKYCFNPESRAEALSAQIHDISVVMYRMSMLPDHKDTIENQIEQLLHQIKFYRKNVDK